MINIQGIYIRIENWNFTVTIKSNHLRNNNVIERVAHAHAGFENFIKSLKNTRYN